MGSLPARTPPALSPSTSSSSTSSGVPRAAARHPCREPDTFQANKMCNSRSISEALAQRSSAKQRETCTTQPPTGPTLLPMASRTGGGYATSHLLLAFCETLSGAMATADTSTTSTAYHFLGMWPSTQALCAHEGPVAPPQPLTA